MADIWMDVDTAVTVPVNLLPLIASADFKTVLASETYNEAGLELIWNFVTTAGVQTHVAVTPTDTGGSYDWVNIGHGMYNIEIPASGGASANNDTEGFGWFTGVATDALPWRGPVIGFRAAALNNSLVDGATVDVKVTATAQIADSIPADGTRPTIEQAIYMIVQYLMERGIVGTTQTIYKADGTTPLLTQTLGDATNPTTITRAS